LSALGIGIPAFRIAGGMLLFLVALDMVFAHHSGLRGATASERAEAHEREDISIFPLAFPLIAGPGAITTVLLMASDSSDLTGQGIRLGVILVVLLITLGSLLLTARIVKVLGETGANVIDRLLGLILAAIAVQFVVDGIREAFALG
ncbi:MAG: MarC family protein, partial [Thiohalorhabdaceae bacterium]